MPEQSQATKKKAFIPPCVGYQEELSLFTAALLIKLNGFNFS